MSLLAGAFLAGLVVLAVPLLLHRMSQREPAERDVSSLMLMRETDEPIRTRRSLAHRVLLALRLAALAVVTLAFAEPVLEMATPAGHQARDRAKLVVVDGSLSMRHDDAWQQATRVVADLVDASADAYVALGTERLTLIGDIRSAAPGFTRFDFAGLPARLDGLIASLPDRDLDWEVHLVSDFQASAVPARFNALVEGTQWPYVLHRVGGEADNWTISTAAVQGGRLEAVVAGHGASKDIDVALRLEDREIGRTTVAAEAGAPTVARFDIGDGILPHRGAALLEVGLAADDAIPADDVFRLVQPAQDATTVAILPGGSGESDTTALQFLVAALKANGVAEPVQVDTAADWPRSVDAAIIVDPGEISTPLRRRLERHLDEGGGTLLIVGSRSHRIGSLPFTGGSLTGSIAGGVQSVAALDAEHPVAQTFHSAGPAVEVKRSLSLPTRPGETILALVPGSSAGHRSEAAAPFVVERRIGKGRLLVLLTALDRDWSSLVLRPAFVGFVRNAVDYLAQNLPLAATAGQAFSIPASSAQIFDAGGQRVLALSSTSTRPVARIPRPGFYTVRAPGREAPMAVNIDPRESDLRSVETELLERWQAATATTAGDAIRDQGGSRSERAIDSMAAESLMYPLARWLLVLAAVLLLVESLAANVGRLAWGVRGLFNWRGGATA
ncbi:MAG: BatA domain-containing protein [Gammaproteobacteria bacterium]|nr:BatA domain-containing protein [Gammaproteobacteria bacterium]MDE0440934.1 BatA domain-containing protein [Gammaproteobacteria bacterium]